MQARDNEILNQEEVDAVGNNEELCVCRALRAKKDFAVVGMGEGGVGEHEHLESKYLGE